MLRSLAADSPSDRPPGSPSFAGCRFGPGVNLLVAAPDPVPGTDAAPDSDAAPGPGSGSGPGDGAGSDTGPGGGPGLVELLHFLLGAPAGPTGLPRHEALREVTFRLELDWPPPSPPSPPSPSSPSAPPNPSAPPTPAAGPLTVRRSGADAARVLVDPDPRGPDDGAGALFSVGTGAVLSPEEWQARIERDLFGLPPHPEGAGLSGRTLLSYVMRREQPRVSDDPTRVAPQQPTSDAAAHVFHLLGLDGELAGELHALALREQTGRQARRAAGDPALRRLLGETGELLGRIQRAEAEAEGLREQVEGFRVAPAFENLMERADELNRRMRTLPDEDAVDRRIAHDLERALSTPEPEAAAAAEDELFAVYEEAGVVLGEQVRRDFDDVRAFHRSVSANRAHHLGAELDEVRARIAERAEERARIGDELAEVLRQLEDGGALEALTATRRALAGREALLETLRHRHEAARALEGSARRLRAERARLLDTAATDLAERESQLAEAAEVFTGYAHRLRGREAEAGLSVEAGPTDLHVTPQLPGSAAVLTLCLDLTLATLAHRHGRGPDFLVHGAHLLGGLEPAQLAAALDLAADVADREGMQYVAVLPDAALAAARAAGYEPGPDATVTEWTAP